MSDHHAVDDVTVSDRTAPSRDTCFRSPCEADVANRSPHNRAAPVDITDCGYLVDALRRDCHLTSHDQFPFPVVKEAGSDDVTTSCDEYRRRGRRTVEQQCGALEWSCGADSSVVSSESTASSDTGNPSASML